MPISLNRTLPSLVRQDNHQGNEPPRWFVMTDHVRLVDPAPLIPELPDNSALIVRDTDIVRQGQTLCRLRSLCRDYNVILLASLNRPQRQLNCDGIHIPEKSLKYWKQSDILRLKPKILTASAHSIRSVMRAKTFGVDACLLSPIFPTQSHKNGSFLGLLRFASICRASQLPLIGLGGISPNQVRRVYMGGAAGIAGIGLFAQL